MDMDMDMGWRSEDLGSLSDEQRCAVESLDRHILVTAGPGSGKTRTLVARIAYLLQHASFRPDGETPVGTCFRRIVVLTFSNKAAAEMEKRLRELLRVDDIRRYVFVGTFHQLALRALRRHGPSVGIASSVRIISESESKQVLANVMEDVPRCTFTVEEAFSEICRLRSRGIRVESPSVSESLRRIWDLFSRELRRSSSLDFDETLLLLRELLEKDPNLTSNVQHILVDEFQDTNRLQLDIISLLDSQSLSTLESSSQSDSPCTNPHSSTLFCVGDVHQSIYAWRDAEPEICKHLNRYFSDLVHLELRANYRSIEPIVRLSDAIVGENRPRPCRPCESMEGNSVFLTHFSSEHEEVNAIADCIRSGFGSGGSLAILVRFNSMKTQFLDALSSRGIRSMESEANQPSLAESTTGIGIIRTLYCIARLDKQKHRNSAMDWLSQCSGLSLGEHDRSLLFPRGNRSHLQPCLQRVLSLSNIQKECSEDVVDFFRETLSLFRSVGSPSSFVPCSQFFERFFHSLEMFLSKSLEHHARPGMSSFAHSFIQDAIDTTSTIRHVFSTLDDEIKRKPFSSKSLCALEESLKNTASTFRTSIEVSVDAPLVSSFITVSTLHAAKGLEWDSVFIPRLNEGVLPSCRASDIDEERRLFYVGVTRARKCLVLSTTSGSCSKDLNVDLSRPLDETKLVPSQIEACDDELTPMAVAGLMDDDSISSVCLDQKVLGVSTCYPSSFLENIHVSLLPVLSLQTYPWCQPLFEESNGDLGGGDSTFSVESAQSSGIRESLDIQSFSLRQPLAEEIEECLCQKVHTKSNSLGRGFVRASSLRDISNVVAKETSNSSLELLLPSKQAALTKKTVDDESLKKPVQSTLMTHFFSGEKRRKISKDLLLSGK